VVNENGPESVGGAAAALTEEEEYRALFGDQGSDTARQSSSIFADATTSADLLLHRSYFGRRAQPLANGPAAAATARVVEEEVVAPASTQSGQNNKVSVIDVSASTQSVVADSYALNASALSEYAQLFGTPTAPTARKSVDASTRLLRGDSEGASNEVDEHRKYFG
jgi:hypothetical protein